MNKISNWDSVQEPKEFERLPAGGYVCRITKVEDVADKQYLKVEFDIAEGTHKGDGIATMERAGFNPFHFIKSYKESATPFFKGFITAIEESNKGYKFDWDEQKLVGKLVGLTIGYEQYIGADGTTKERTYVDKIRNVEKIKANDFKVPELKKVENPNEPMQVQDSDASVDLPF